MNARAYKLLYHVDNEMLSKSVELHLKEGWQLYGSPGVSRNSNGMNSFTQAVIRV